VPTFGSLFAGIGGIDLGLERAGWTSRWQVEWDPYCQHVLAHHWPDVPRYGDIRSVHGAAACPNSDGGRMLTHQAKESDPEGTASGGQLNPTWVEWLMGFPPGWTDCEHLATPSFRKSLKSSGGGS
jgi:hypothetical protein